MSCHTPPHFTDFSFHNTGVSQIEYDALHGSGAFERLIIPGLKERNAAPERFLPASPGHPLATAVWRSVPATDRPGFADLGRGTYSEIPTFRRPSDRCVRFYAASRIASGAMFAATLLPLTIGMFKTPTLRDLGNPDLTCTRERGLELRTYFVSIAGFRIAHADVCVTRIRQISKIHFGPSDVAALAAFLKSLNEDYKEVRGVSNLGFRRLLWYGPLAPGTSGLTEALTKARIDLIAVHPVRRRSQSLRPNDSTGWSST